MSGSHDQHNQNIGNITPPIYNVLVWSDWLGCLLDSCYAKLIFYPSLSYSKVSGGTTHAYVLRKEMFNLN